MRSSASGGTRSVRQPERDARGASRSTHPEPMHQGSWPERERRRWQCRRSLGEFGAAGKGGGNGGLPARSRSRTAAPSSTEVHGRGILAQAVAGGGGSGGSASGGVVFDSGGSAGQPQQSLPSRSKQRVDRTSGAKRPGSWHSRRRRRWRWWTSQRLIVASWHAERQSSLQTQVGNVTLNSGTSISTTGRSAIAPSSGSRSAAAAAMARCPQRRGSASAAAGGQGGSGGGPSATPSRPLATGPTGIVMQSIGGAAATRATQTGSVSSPRLRFGGSGGSGGAVGPGLINLSGKHQYHPTEGPKAAGLCATMIGGGGGTGGEAFTGSVGAGYSVSAALAARAGPGKCRPVVPRMGELDCHRPEFAVGDGSGVQRPVHSLPCNQLPSIPMASSSRASAAGGGAGGSASAKALAFAVPVDEAGDQISLPRRWRWAQGRPAAGSAAKPPLPSVRVERS